MLPTSRRATDQITAGFVELSTNEAVADVDAAEAWLSVDRGTRLGASSCRPASRHFQSDRVVIRQRISATINRL